MNITAMPHSFFEPSARTVAFRLLGHWLIRRTARGICGGPIVETEAYLRDDPASHGYVGLTHRNRAMFGPPGTGYVYMIYGNHFCVNAVCRKAGNAEAVLIRAIEAEFSLDLLRKNRPIDDMSALTNGPGKLCQAMQIDRKLDGTDLCDGNSPLVIGANPNVRLFRKERGPVITTTRIGITRAVEMPLRFYLNGSPYISKRIRVKP